MTDRVVGRWRLLMVLVALLLTTLVQFSNALSKLDGAWSDTLIRWLAPETTGCKVLVIGDDDEAQKFWPEPRVMWGEHYAKAIENIYDYGGKRAIMDVAFEAKTDEALEEFVGRLDSKLAASARDNGPNRALASAVLQHPTTVLGVSDPQQLADVFQYDGFTYGSMERPSSVDQVGREAFVRTERENGGLETLASKAAEYEGTGVAGERFVVGFAKHIETISFKDLLPKKGEPSEAVKRKIKGALVFMGVTATGEDHFATPMGADTAGLVFQAQAAAALADGRVYHNASPFAILLLALISSLAFSHLWNLNLARNGFLFQGFVFAIVGISLAFAKMAKMVVPIAAPVLALTLVSAFEVFFDLIQSRFETLRSELAQAKLEGTMSAMISKPLLKELSEHPEIAAKEGHEANVICLMLDIRESVRRGEALGAGAYLSKLNKFFEFVVKPVEKNGGFVSRFTGDGYLAIFGYPNQDESSLKRAYQAGLEIIGRVHAFNREISPEDPWKIGIGIHQGPSMFGGIGQEDRWELTVIGPSPNIASRLEALSKEFACNLVVVSEVYEELGRPSELKYLGKAGVKGLAEAVDLYGLPRDVEPNLSLRA